MASRALVVVLVPAASLAAAAQTAPAPLRSPSGELEIAFATLAGTAPSERGQLAYRIAFRGKPVLDWSSLGLDIQGALSGLRRNLKADPATWDETRVLNRLPARFITIARRRGTEWYLGSITDRDARDLEVPLAFLGEGGYTTDIYADAADAAMQRPRTRHANRSASQRRIR